MLPPRRERPLLERLLVRLIATFGIVAIGVAIAAIMVSSNSRGLGGRSGCLGRFGGAGGDPVVVAHSL